MNTARFVDRTQFPVLDLIAQFEFKSESSISFNLVRGSNTVFRRLGWVDVHHPCEGHIKTQLRASIPAQNHEYDQMESLVRTVFLALEIPLDETYEALFFSTSQITGIEQATNREGYTDRLY